MAYSKQTWTNDVTAITAERMTHIENGIYDNSLATDKINPSGTATTTAEIEEGQISDVIGFKSLKLKGQTSQYTTTGSQLFDINNTPSANRQYVINNGFKLTKGTNRTIQISLPNPIPAGTYYISADVTNSTLSGNNKINVSFKDANNTDVVGNVTFLTNGAVTTTAEVKDLYFFIASNEANTATITLDNIMLNSGSTRKDFEKYTGGKASPNPDFPQDVNNVSGYNEINICGKNLFDKDNIISGYRLDGSGNPSSSANNEFTSDFIPVKSGTTYIRSYGNISAYTRTCFYDKNKSFVSKNDDSQSFTIPINVKYIRFSEYLSKLDTMQLEQGSSATSYTAHQGNNFEINLGKNILDYATNIIENALINTTGLIATTSECTTVWCKVKPNTTYTLSREKGDRIVIGGSNTQPALNLTTTLLKNEGVTEVKNYTFNSGNYQYVAIYISRYTTTKPTWVQVEKGTIATSYADYFPPIEICKIGIHQDYIYKKDGKWYKYKAIEKIILNGTESWVLDGALTNTNRFRTSITSYNTQNIALASNGFSNQLQIINAYSDDSEHLYTYKPSSVMHLYVFYTKTRCADLAGLQAYLSANNLIIYGILNTPIEEEITYTPLIRQLDELYNSGLYDVTNISQDNSSEAFILDLEACKNNINGIVEYIRR